MIKIIIGEKIEERTTTITIRITIIVKDFLQTENNTRTAVVTISFRKCSINGRNTFCFSRRTKKGKLKGSSHEVVESRR